MRWIVHGERSVYDCEWLTLALTDVEIPGGERFEHHVVRVRDSMSWRPSLEPLAVCSAPLRSGSRTMRRAVDSDIHCCWDRKPLSCRDLPDGP